MWLPLFLIWILLLSFAVLLPFAALVLLVCGMRVWPVLGGLLQAFGAMRGIHVDVRAPGNSVFVPAW